MNSDQAVQLLQMQAAMMQYSQDLSVSAAQINAASQIQATVLIYLLGSLLVLGILIAALLRPRNR